MHELSIALSMIEMASEEAARRGSFHVAAIHLKLGALSGVVKDALTFSFEIACQGTALEGSQLIVEDVPVTIHCTSCRAEHATNTIQDLRCPRCGGTETKVVRGKDLEVVAIELEEAEEVVS